VKHSKEPPGGGVAYPRRELLDPLYEMEEGVEAIGASFRIFLREILERIIEKRLEYYILPPDESEM
jgi:hypothetical protein